MTALPLLLLLGAPRILAPGRVSQTTQATVRIFVEAHGPVEIRAGERTVGSCRLQGSALTHCDAPLEAGENRLSIVDASGASELTVLRYLTTGPLIPGVDTAGFGVGTMHRPEVEAQCAKCHDMNEAGGKPADVSLLGTQCARCHADVVARTKQHGPVGQGMCIFCHDAGSRPQRYAVDWPIQRTCFRCHADIEQAMAKKAYRHGPAAAGRCTTCHDPHGSENQFWLKRKSVFEMCTNCHTEKATDRHVVLGFVYGDSHPMRGRPHPMKPGQEFGCSGCHNPHAAQARYLWQYDKTVREDLCRTCHPK